MGSSSMYLLLNFYKAVDTRAWVFEKEVLRTLAI